MLDSCLHRGSRKDTSRHAPDSPHTSALASRTRLFARAFTFVPLFPDRRAFMIAMHSVDHSLGATYTT